MGFDWPVFLLALLLVPLFALLYAGGQRRRHRYQLSYSSVALVSQAYAREQNRRRHAPAVLFLLAIGVLSIGVARPHAIVPTPTSGGTVMLVIDASGSMNTEDVGMARIDAAKIALREFVRREPAGTRIGVVAFSAGAFLLTPPTTNREQVLGAVNYLSTSRGTNIGAGLQVALDTLSSQRLSEMPGMNLGAGTEPAKEITVIGDPDTTSIILLSDGASTTGRDPLTVAQQVGRAGVRTYAVGFGSRERGSGGRVGGFRQLDESTLKGIAEFTDGEYFTAENAGQLSKVYDKIGRRIQFEDRQVEVTFITAAAGLVLLLAGGVLGALWSVRLP